MDDLITLVGTGYESNSIGERVPVETETEVWAHVKHITRAEWMEAARMGLRASFEFETPAVNYSGEKILIYLGNRYAIYRTYFVEETDIVELYAEFQAGVK